MSALRQPGSLFVDLSASALLQRMRGRLGDALVQSIRKLGLQPRMLVVEITEHERVADIQALGEEVQQVHAAGVMLAIDDFGDGRSSLRLWSELKPDIVKIDKYFTADLSRQATKLQTLRALMQMPRSSARCWWSRASRLTPVESCARFCSDDGEAIPRPVQQPSRRQRAHHSMGSVSQGKSFTNRRVQSQALRFWFVASD